MNLEPSCPGILFVAPLEAADKRLQPCVGQLVRLQMAFGDEVLLTLRAGEGALPSVGPHVRFQVAGLLKLLETALKRANQQLNFIFGALYSLNGCRIKIKVRMDA